MTTPPTIYLIDDDPRVLNALGQLLRAERFAVQAFASPRLFLRAYDPGLPGCIVCDVAMPHCDGLELQRRLRARGNRSPIVFLSGQSTIPGSVKAMKAGAIDFLTKPIEPKVLLKTVQHAVERDRETRAREALIADLTPRERSVAEGISAGRLSKQIAGELGITERTIKYHRRNLMNKLGLSSPALLVRLAVHSGLVKPTLPDAAGPESVDPADRRRPR